MTRDRFLHRIEVFLRRTKMYESHLGRDAVNDTSFVSRLRAGREARESTQARMLEWMAAYESGRALAAGEPVRTSVPYAEWRKLNSGVLR
jgi:hypothetical protein